jgi:hypothetical protein
MFIEVIEWSLVGLMAIAIVSAISHVVRGWRHEEESVSDWREQYKGVEGVDEPFERRFRNPHDPDDD